MMRESQYVLQLYVDTAAGSQQTEIASAAQLNGPAAVTVVVALTAVIAAVALVHHSAAPRTLNQC
jgi:hypothetical protein